MTTGTMKSRRLPFPLARFASTCDWSIALKTALLFCPMLRPMPVDALSFQRVTWFKASDCPGPVLDCQQASTAENLMHSILLVIPKPEANGSGTEQVWKAVAPGLQQRARQAGGVKMLYENCWLIPAEKSGLSFFDHAITVADGEKLSCRICLLRTPQREFVRWLPQIRLKRLRAATARTFQGAFRFFLKPITSRGLVG